MSKEQNVVNYYVICNRLKDIIRTGWKNWNVQRERIEEFIDDDYMEKLANHYREGNIKQLIK